MYVKFSIPRVVCITATVYLTVQVLKGLELATSPYMSKMIKKIQDKADSLS